MLCYIHLMMMIQMPKKKILVFFHWIVKILMMMMMARCCVSNDNHREWMCRYKKASWFFHLKRKIHFTSLFCYLFFSTENKNKNLHPLSTVFSTTTTTTQHSLDNDHLNIENTVTWNKTKKQKEIPFEKHHYHHHHHHLFFHHCFTMCPFT